MGSLKGIPLQKGFGLLEVLITIVVLGVGMIALARLQALLLQGGSYAKARSVALNLAQGKLEDLRSFEQLQLPAPNAGIFTYAEIGNNTGGVEKDDGTLVIPSGEVTVSNVIYNRAWTVTSHYYCAENQSPSPSNCSLSKPYPDFKIVKITITWTDPVDLEDTQPVELESVISATNPAKGIRALVSPAPNETPK
jgi:prepilin-type N-terminal cleavage/methylation domain-containing protein